jgi:O-antigen ligase
MQAISITSYIALLAFCGAAWVPISAGLEVSNIVAVFIIIAGVCAMGRTLTLAPIYMLLIGAMLFLFFGLALHGLGGEGQAVRATVYVLMGLAIAQMPQPSLKTPVVIATILFMGLIFISSVIAEINLINAIIEYLTSLNRTNFVYQTIRPMLNAFTTGDENYVASVVNQMASALAILFVIAITHRAYFSAIASGLMIFILFSSSAVLAVVMMLFVLGIRWVKISKTKIGPIIIMAIAIAALPLVIIQAEAYLVLNISGDDASRSARLYQYSAAIEYINANTLFGFGYIEIDSSTIHNSFLFSWVSAGIIPAVCIAGVYILTIRKMVLSSAKSMNGNIKWVCVFGLLAIFIIRISFGGGGGLPGSTTMAALAIALGLERHLIDNRVEA